MTFPRRGTRRLTVSGRRFVWHMSPKYIDYAMSQCTIQLLETPGRLLCFWPTDGVPSPKEACEVIAFALANGWDPARSGAPLWLDRHPDGWRLTEARPARTCGIDIAWAAARPVPR